MTRYAIMEVFGPQDPEFAVNKIEAHSPLEALAKYSVAEGFADPRQFLGTPEDFFTFGPAGNVTMHFTNTELRAVKLPDEPELAGDGLPFCTCDFEETGDAESGPSMSMTRMDENCGRHGREAQPEEWERYDLEERSLTLSLIGSALHALGRHELLEGNEALSLEEFEKRAKLYSDEHGDEKAATDVAALLLDTAEVAPAAEAPRACRFCGGRVESTNPETDFCRNCFYTGRHYVEKFEGLLDALGSLEGVEEATVWHTGGGCFNFAVKLSDGRLITPSVASLVDGVWWAEAGLPERDEKWAVIIAESEQAWSEWDEAKLEMPNIALNEVELVAFVANLAGPQASRKAPETGARNEAAELPDCPGCYLGDASPDAHTCWIGEAARECAARTILCHLNVEVDGADPREPDHIAANLESALHVGLEGAPEDQAGVRRVFFTRVEEV